MEEEEEETDDFFRLWAVVTLRSVSIWMGRGREVTSRVMPDARERIRGGLTLDIIEPLLFEMREDGAEEDGSEEEEEDGLEEEDLKGTWRTQ